MIYRFEKIALGQKNDCMTKTTPALRTPMELRLLSTPMDRGALQYSRRNGYGYIGGGNDSAQVKSFQAEKNRINSLWNQFNASEKDKYRNQYNQRIRSLQGLMTPPKMKGTTPAGTNIGPKVPWTPFNKMTEIPGLVNIQPRSSARIDGYTWQTPMVTFPNGQYRVNPYYGKHNPGVQTEWENLERQRQAALAQYTHPFLQAMINRNFQARQDQLNGAATLAGVTPYYPPQATNGIPTNQQPPIATPTPVANTQAYNTPSQTTSTYASPTPQAPIGRISGSLTIAARKAIQQGRSPAEFVEPMIQAYMRHLSFLPAYQNRGEEELRQLAQQTALTHLREMGAQF